MAGCFWKIREDSVFNRIFLPSPAEENRLGEMFLNELRRTFTFIDDPFVTDYLNSVGQRLAAQAQDQPFPFHFYILADPRINAFAGPGGQIFITAGLAGQANDESELAGVLSHEIAHVARRHIARMIQQQQGMALPTIAGIMAGMMVPNPQAGQAIIAGTIAGVQSMALGYTRVDEEEADQYGLSYLPRAGYDPHGIIRFLGRLVKDEGIESGTLAPYLETHPPLIQRIGYLESLAPPVSRAATNPVGSDRLKLIQAKLIAEYKGIEVARGYFEEKLKYDPKNPDPHFGMGLLYKRQKMWGEALAEINKSMDLSGPNAQILWELGNVYLQKGDFDNAAVSFSQAAALDSKNKNLFLALGQAYHEAKKYEAAVKSLENAIALDADLVDACYELGIVYGEMEKYGQAHYYLGRSYFLIGDMENARFHFHKALEFYDPESPDAQKIKDEMEKMKR
ncbi:MAG: M48 family metalloprotease [Proteobacteria bacterium]|nr:M48 family metalloprotease [Pseudomonadota bacterium]